MEHLALCVRFVDDKGNIREKFLAFITLEQITGRQIAASVCNFCERMGSMLRICTVRDTMVQATCLPTELVFNLSFVKLHL